MPDTPQAVQPSDGPVAWVRTPDALQALAARLARARVIALDSESDSLHHFPEKVCLVQLAQEDGAVHLLDPLALPDLRPLAPVCADPAVVKVFHGASYDLSSMKRDFGFEFATIFDTLLAAQFLGLPALGLDALLQQTFGIPPGRSSQKDDWARRPLTAAQEAYAAQDVRYLLPLREHLLRALQAAGREAWVAEECAALATIPAAERVFDPGDYSRVKGARDLDRRGLAVLRELFVAREAWAQAAGRPPFKVLGNEALVRLAAARPRGRAGLRKIPGCSATVVDRYGEGILAAVARAAAVLESVLPTYPRPKPPRLSPATQRRIAALTRWRAATAEGLQLDPGVLLPRRLIERVAEEAPADSEALAGLEGFRRWRTAHFGSAILEILAGAAAGPEPSSRQDVAGPRR